MAETGATEAGAGEAGAAEAGAGEAGAAAAGTTAIRSTHVANRGTVAATGSRGSGTRAVFCRADCPGSVSGAIAAPRWAPRGTPTGRPVRRSSLGVRCRKHSRTGQPPGRRTACRNLYLPMAKPLAARSHRRPSSSVPSSRPVTGTDDSVGQQPLNLTSPKRKRGDSLRRLRFGLARSLSSRPAQIESLTGVPLVARCGR